jgi:hypothetical protein
MAMLSALDGVSIHAPREGGDDVVSMISETTLSLKLVYNPGRESDPCHEAIVQSNRNDQHAADVISALNPEVVPKAERRRLSAQYKPRILAAADAYTQRRPLALCRAGKSPIVRTWTSGVRSADDSQDMEIAKKAESQAPSADAAEAPTTIKEGLR